MIGLSREGIPRKGGWEYENEDGIVSGCGMDGAFFLQRISQQKNQLTSRFILHQLGRLSPENTRRFPFLPHGGFSLIGRILFALRIHHYLIKVVDFVNRENELVKIIF